MDTLHIFNIVGLVVVETVFCLWTEFCSNSKAEMAGPESIGHGLVNDHDFEQDQVSQSQEQLQSRPAIQIRSAIARSMYERMRNDEQLRHYDKSKWYMCDLSQHPAVSKSFLQFTPDEETLDFIEKCFEKSDWLGTQVWHSVAKSFLSWFMTQTSINGLLGRGSMFVFSHQQFRQLLPFPVNWKGETLLDLGAGDGKITEVMAPYFQEVYATEISAPMRWTLSQQGFRLLDIDSWHNVSLKYDVISCLNLLDRCDKPLTMLQQMKSVLKPDGYLIVAVVLPYRPYVEIGTNGHAPIERLPIEGLTFEAQAASAIKNVFEPQGFEVIRWTRLPYLCEGDLQQSLYWLDDAVFILKVQNMTSYDCSTGGNEGGNCPSLH